MKIKVICLNFLLSAILSFCTCSPSVTAQERTFSILDFGASPDQTSLNTEAIQSAIDKASKIGGGKVVIPKGRFLTGSIVLKSNVDLFLEDGAVLLGSTNPGDYFKMDFPGRPDSPKKDDNSQMALILAHKANNISILGKGEIDGQGLQLALNIDSLHHAGIAVDPKYNDRRHRPNETMRPKLLRFSQCKNVLIRDLKMGGAACWGLSFELCQNLTVDGITVINRSYWNNDGMDITDSRNVKIVNCDVNSADDGICLKSYYPDHANDSIYIANCTIRSSASAIKFGSASFGGFKNVTIKDIKVFDTFRSVIALESVDGAIIDNINISNIEAKNTANAIFIRLGHRSGEKPGRVSNVSIRDMKVQVPFGRPDIEYDLRGPEVDFFHNPFPSSIVGLKEYPVENVTLENIKISYPGRATRSMAYVPLSRLDAVPEKVKDYPEFSMFGELPAYGLFVRHASSITMKNVRFTLDEQDFRPAFVFDDVKGVWGENLNLPDSINQLIFKNVDSQKLDQNASAMIKEYD